MLVRWTTLQRLLPTATFSFPVLPASFFIFFDQTFTTFSFLSLSFLSSLHGGRGGGSLRAVNAPRSATKGWTKRSYIPLPHQVPLWLSAPSACAAHLLPQDTSGKRARCSAGGGVGGCLKSNPVSPCRTSRRCRCFCCRRLAGSVFRWMTRTSYN